MFALSQSNPSSLTSGPTPAATPPTRSQPASPLSRSHPRSPVEKTASAGSQLPNDQATKGSSGGLPKREANGGPEKAAKVPLHAPPSDAGRKGDLNESESEGEAEESESGGSHSHTEVASLIEFGEPSTPEVSSSETHEAPETTFAK